MMKKRPYAFNSSTSFKYSSFLSLAYHSLLHLLQAAPHGAVVERRAYARHDAAYERVVNLELKTHHVARHLREPRAQSFLRLRRERARGRHVRVADAGAAVEFVLELLVDLDEVCEPLILKEHLQEVLRRRTHARTADEFAEDSALLLVRYRRMPEDVGQLWVLAHHLGPSRQLFANLLRLAVRRHDISQRDRVTARNRLQAQRLAPPNSSTYSPTRRASSSGRMSLRINSSANFTLCSAAKARNSARAVFAALSISRRACSRIFLISSSVERSMRARSSAASFCA